MQTETVTQAEEIREKVRAGYGAIAENTSQHQGTGCCGTKVSCCGTTTAEDSLAAAIGYSKDELSQVPEGANMGLSCGNPTALASLCAGETVLDLGAGGGFDVFIAGRKVGATGRAIGVDMTAAMVSKARRNLAQYAKSTGLQNVEFRLGEIEHLPVADASADVVISNCVINLSPDKPQVWREIARVLKSGGRVAVSDIALIKPLPAEISSMVEALVGCIAGASLIADIERMLAEAGFTDVRLTRKDAYVDAMIDGKNELYEAIVRALPAGTKVSSFVTSLDIGARKA